MKDSSTPCDGCLQTSPNKKHSGHKRRDALTRNAKRSTEKGHWHCDIMKMSQKGYYKNCLVMVEQRSRYTQLCFTTEDINAAKAIELFELTMTEMRKEENHINTMRWDGEMAIWSDEFKSWCENNNIKRIRSASGEQNLAEMKIKVLKARAQKMCEEARDLPAHFEYLLYRHAAH